MGAFDSMDIAATGANMSQTWLNVLANNIANINTVRPPDEEPFRAKLVVAQEVIGGHGTGGSGVEVTQLLDDQTDPLKVYDPGHPFADEEGYVLRPAVDLAVQMSDLIIAQRSYQLNIQVIQTSEETYQAALRIGQ
ncbi:flagellar basal-body rod protein FlgC [bacterium BMS3Bbin02]|nr:flagellar basal-body rod protein FlgC [bacterium BMS3Bbin02]